jgi:hypothetical protein
MSKTVAEMKALFIQGTQRMESMASQVNFPVTFERKESPQQLHDMYARNLFACYVSKYAQLSTALIESVDKEQFLIYGLTGRSLIEMVATLRYYILYQYKPLLDQEGLSNTDLLKLIEIDERHLKGSRFNWEAYMLKQYEKLLDETVKQFKNKKDKQKAIADGIKQEQVNVLTCIEKWADETPSVLVAYNLFCDLVHPNMGSTFLVASTTHGELHFSASKGKNVGARIFEQSFPLLVTLTMKPFGDNLMLLIATIFEELPSERLH